MVETNTVETRNLKEEQNRPAIINIHAGSVELISVD